jgi:hypothetical protein
MPNLKIQHPHFLIIKDYYRIRTDQKEKLATDKWILLLNKL